MAKFAPHMGDPHGDPQTSPQDADPHGFLGFLKKTIQEIHVDRRVVGWSAGRHVDRPCGGQISPWPARKVTEEIKVPFTPNVLQINSPPGLFCTVKAAIGI